MHIFALPDDVLGQIFNNLRHGSSTCCSDVVDSQDAMSFAFSNRRLREIYKQACLRSLRFAPCKRHHSLSRPAALCSLAGQQLREFSLVTSTLSRTTNRPAVPLHVVLDVLAESCSQLQCIDLSHANGLNWHSCAPAFRRFLHMCKKLRSVHVGSVPQKILNILAAAGGARDRDPLQVSSIALQDMSLLDFGCNRNELFRVLSPFRSSLRSLAISGGILHDDAIQGTLSDIMGVDMAIPSLDFGFEILEKLYVGPLAFTAETSHDVLQTMLFASRSTLQTLILEQIEGEELAALIAMEVPKCLALKEVELLRCDVEGSLEHVFRAVGRLLTAFSSMRAMSGSELACLRQFCPNIKALSLTHSSSFWPESSSIAREGELLILELQGSLESLEVTHVKDIQSMMAVSHITGLKHLKLHFDFEPEILAVESLLSRAGASLRSLNIEARGLGTSVDNTEYILRIIEEYCPKIISIELDLWHFGSLRKGELRMHDCLVSEFEARVPSCSTKWTRVHLREALVGYIANYQRS